ncbi:hypothetical protein VN0244_10730 [Helicobacter pylori]|nr:hypothetical protein VN0244_10730 [Helicobacter pylori]
MAQIITQNLESKNNTIFQKKGYSSHYKGVVLIIKRFREIQKSVCIFGKELPIYKFARLQTTA